MKIFQLCFFLVCCSFHVFSQEMEEDYCNHVKFHTPYWSNFMDFFPPNQIKKANYKKLIITNYETSDLIDDSKKIIKIGGEKIVSYTFNEKGYVLTRTDHQTNKVNSYKRDTNNRIIQKVRDNSIVHDFFYNDDKNEMKLKKRVKGEIVADTLTDYGTIKKDKQGRIIKEINYRFQYNEEIGAVETYEYNDANYFALRRHKKTVFDVKDRVDTIFYNSNWQPIKHNFDASRKNVKRQRLYSYNDNGQIIYIKNIYRSSDINRISELIYEYNENQLLRKVTFINDNNYCTMYYKYE